MFPFTEGEQYNGIQPLNTWLFKALSDNELWLLYNIEVDTLSWLPHAYESPDKGVLWLDFYIDIYN